MNLHLVYITAFLLGSFVVWRNLRQAGYEEEKIIDLILFSVLSGLLVGRLVIWVQAKSLFALLQPDEWLELGTQLLTGLGGTHGVIFLFGFLLTAYCLLLKFKWPMPVVWPQILLGLGLSVGIIFAWQREVLNLVLTGVAVLVILKGEEIWRELVKGFKAGYRNKLI